MTTSRIMTLVRRVPWLSLVLITPSPFMWQSAQKMIGTDTMFFCMGMAVLFFLTGLITLYLHAIWYRLWRIDQRGR